MPKKSPHIGSSFESWLDDEGIRAEVITAAIHALTADVRKAIAEARKGGFASDDEVAGFWKRHRINPKRTGRRRTKRKQA